MASGHVNRERELLWCAKLGDQPFKRLAQVSHGSLAGITLAVSAHTRTQLCVGAPQTQGKVERFQQTLKNWLRAQPVQPATLAQLQD